MPKAFTKCVNNGGRVRTISVKGGQKYLRVCFPKGGGPSVSGEVKKKKGK